MLLFRIFLFVTSLMYAFAEKQFRCTPGYDIDGENSPLNVKSASPVMKSCSTPPSTRHTHKTVIATAIVPILMFCCLVSFFPGSGLATELFPRYPSIRANITFWTKIYSTHSVNSAVIHDRDDLSKIYEVIQLLDKELPGAERINRMAVKLTEDKYTHLLTSLAKGKAASSNDEKRVAALFEGPQARKQMGLAASAVRSQTGQKERFTQGVIRSGAYMEEIRRIFIAQGLPAELAYLPHVESSFNPKAYSKFGAAGIWQFTRATGKQYLQINDAVDERRDPLIAAEAAAKYLKEAYRKLGNWPLALTAYNYGTAGMLRAREAKGSYEKIFAEYRGGHFGFASQNFYAEFLAALQVARKLEKDPQVQRDKPVRFTEHVLPGYISIADVRRHLHVSQDLLKRLNPALKDPVFAGNKLLPRGYSLRLPAKRNTAALISSLPRSSFSSSQVQDARYQVKPGDTAGGIAARHGIKLSTLLTANSLDRDARIYIGQRLRIPSPADDGSLSALLPYLIASDNKRFSASKNQGGKGTAKRQSQPVLSAGKKFPPSSTPVAQMGASRDVIIVHPEESLALYAHWLNIGEEKLRQTNNLSGLDSIYPGQEITILYSRVTAADFANLRAEFARETEEDFFSAYTITDQKTYIVQQGDTLWDICNRKFNIPLWLLKKYNNNLDYARIHASQRLTVPMVHEL